ncbi:MAG: hypothetical protein IT439_00485 [Phycisphaerales bacterium]|nr:hypothetical protein [Phycisphaerales bacterium]
MRLIHSAASSVLLAAGALPLAAQPFDLPVDSSQSSVRVELCIPAGCDDDTSPVSGFMRLSLDSVDQPGAVTLHDFEFNLTEQIDLLINAGPFVGRLTATGSNLSVFDQLGGPLGPVIVDEDDTFGFTDVPAAASGTMAYTATSLICAALSASGLPCSDTINLADQGGQIVDSIGGTLTSAARTVTVVSMIDLTMPIVPDDPSVGTIHITGTIRGSVFVPFFCPADLTGASDPNDPSYGDPDGSVDAADFFYFLDQFALGNLGAADLTGSSDPNDPGYGAPDGVIDAADFFYYLDLFVQGCS